MMRHEATRRRSRSLGAAFAVTVAGLLGCETSPPPAGSQTYAEVTQEGYCYAQKKVDVLMVVDDSVSMGVFRPLWVVNLSSFINVLEAEDVDANYRIAVTTSSVTGPGCADGNDGRLVFDSCVANLDSLTGGPDLDGKAVDLAPICSETCDAASLDAPRPWLAYVDGIPNVEIATSMAMTCAGQLPTLYSPGTVLSAAAQTIACRPRMTAESADHVGSNWCRPP